MREAITDTFRKTLSEAQSAARALNQDFVGTEHFMLGLLTTDGEAAQALITSHGEPAKLRTVLQQALPRGEQPPVVTGDLPLSPRAQRAINGAIVKAQSMRESRVSTRFLLLSLLDEPGTLMRDALDKCGVDFDVLQPKLAEKPATLEK
jgi:ATP-dependent Clp protease ATP-binding subunit ClpC